MSEKYYLLYKKLFIRNSFKLFFSSILFRLINFFSLLFFSRAKKRTELLVFTDKLLNKKICQCHKYYKKCEYYKRKLNNNRKNYLSA